MMIDSPRLARGVGSPLPKEYQDEREARGTEEPDQAQVVDRVRIGKQKPETNRQLQTDNGERGDRDHGRSTPTLAPPPEAEGLVLS